MEMRIIFGLGALAAIVEGLAPGVVPMGLLALVLVVVGLTFVSLSWLLWAVLMVTMLILMGPRHPRTLDDHVPLDNRRRWVALATAAIFILCFTPAPIQIEGLLTEP